MIASEPHLIFAAWLRQKIIDLISGVHDAPDIAWSDQTPNWLTQDRIDALIKEAESKLFKLGATRLILHGSCGSPQHSGLVVKNWSGVPTYWLIEFDDGTTAHDHFDGKTLTFKGVSLSTEFDIYVHAQKEELAPCPCRTTRRKVKHTVMPGYAWPSENSVVMSAFFSTLAGLCDASERSADRRPRSAIREQLLTMLIDMERLIVPQTAEEYIKNNTIC